ITYATSDTLATYTTLFRSRLSLQQEYHRWYFPYDGRANHSDAGLRASTVTRDTEFHSIQPRPKLSAASIWARTSARPYELPKSRSEEHTSELQSRENLVCR